MTNKIRFESYVAQAITAGGLILKHGTADGTAALATAATDALLGAADVMPDGSSKAVGEMVDVHIGEFGYVTAGGNVTRGDRLTADAASKAIATTTVGNRVIGFAEQSGVANDVIKFRVAPHTL